MIATDAPGSIRSVVMISVRPALPILVVLTLQAAEPAPLPVFSTLISTESPPGIETGALTVSYTHLTLPTILRV